MGVEAAEEGAAVAYPYRLRLAVLATGAAFRVLRQSAVASSAERATEGADYKAVGRPALAPLAP